MLYRFLDNKNEERRILLEGGSTEELQWKRTVENHQANQMIFIIGMISGGCIKVVLAVFLISKVRRYHLLVTGLGLVVFSEILLLVTGLCIAAKKATFKVEVVLDWIFGFFSVMFSIFLWISLIIYVYIQNVGSQESKSSKGDYSFYMLIVTVVETICILVFSVFLCAYGTAKTSFSSDVHREA